MNPTVTHRDLVIGWFRRSMRVQTTPTEFDPFVYLWFSFNAWASYSADTYSDGEMWRWFARSALGKRWHSHLIESDNEYVASLKRLATFAVKDMRDPENEDKASRLWELDSLYQLMGVIYRIRCNLFHGEKNLDVPHDVELVQLAYRILVKLFRPFVENEEGQAFPSV